MKNPQTDGGLVDLEVAESSFEGPCAFGELGRRLVLCAHAVLLVRLLSRVAGCPWPPNRRRGQSLAAATTLITRAPDPLDSPQTGRPRGSRWGPGPVETSVPVSHLASTDNPLFICTRLHSVSKASVACLCPVFA